MKRHFLKYFFPALLVIVLVGVAAAASQTARVGKSDKSGLVPHAQYNQYKKTTVSVKETVFDASIADTDLLRSLGLSVFSSLSSREAMLFTFDAPGEWGFWMKGMKFPIDIVWVSADSRIVTIKESVSPATFPETFFPAGPALYVIEFPAGTMKEIGAKEGDIVSIGDLK